MSTHDNALLRGCCDDEPDYLKDKPEGFCPWCGEELEFDDDGDCIYCPTSLCSFQTGLSEAGNRKRYAEQAEAAAQRQERINRELARRGE